MFVVIIVIFIVVVVVVVVVGYIVKVFVMFLLLQYVVVLLLLMFNSCIRTIRCRFDVSRFRAPMVNSAFAAVTSLPKPGYYFAIIS